MRQYTAIYITYDVLATSIPMYSLDFNMHYATGTYDVNLAFNFCFTLQLAMHDQHAELKLKLKLGVANRKPRNCNPTENKKYCEQRLKIDFCQQTFSSTIVSNSA